MTRGTHTTTAHLHDGAAADEHPRLFKAILSVAAACAVVPG
jgi:hypothetical protein